MLIIARFQDNYILCKFLLIFLPQEGSKEEKGEKKPYTEPKRQKKALLKEAPKLKNLNH